MEQSTVSFNRQVIRLCKGILKAWEQWMDEVEYANPKRIHKIETPEEKKKRENQDVKFMNP